MPHINIFDQTCTDSLSGIKDLYLATRYEDGSALDYPLPVTYQEGSTNIITLGNDYDNRVITIGGRNIVYRDIYPNQANFNQEVSDERQGKVFTQTLEFNIPKVNVTTNNQIREFLFDSNGEFAISRVLVLIKDNNNLNWIAGYNIPLEISEFDLQTDYKGGNNSYSLQYTVNSYQPAVQYTII